ncbi:MAG: CPBP family intramembrane metalloprotease [Clostridia bacterium]|nr:CPBP family intramembrane metalloprotease [Clostridia bacterium]
MKKEKIALRKDIELTTASLILLIAIGAEILFQSFVLLLGLSDTARNWTIVIGNQLVFFVVCLVATRAFGSDLAELTGVKRPPKPYFFPLFLLAAVLCVFAFAPLAGLLSQGLKALGYDYTPQYFVPYDNAGFFVLALLALTFLPMLGEEVMMRGVLFSGAKKRSPLFAIFFSAAVFALFHGNLVQLIHQFCLGAVIGYLVWLTGSIYAGAVVHGANNACALLIDYLYLHNKIGTRAYGYFTADLSSGLKGGVLAAVLVASWILLAGLLFLLKKMSDQAGLSQTERAVEDGAVASLSEGEGKEAASSEKKGAWIPPALLVGTLLLLLVANVVSEVMQK